LLFPSTSTTTPEKLRGVFQVLLSHPSSRELMKQLLAEADPAFNEAAFEAQVGAGGRGGWRLVRRCSTDGSSFMLGTTMAVYVCLGLALQG
jgi:hypothetical protein